LATCPTCGKDLTWIPQYERFYCYAEKKYASREYAASASAPGSAIPLGGAGGESHVGHYHCPTCGAELTFIPQYDRYYCYAEKKYAPKDLAPVGLGHTAELAPDATRLVEATKMVEPKPAEPIVAPEVFATPPVTPTTPASIVMPEPTPMVLEEKPEVGAEEVLASAVQPSPETVSPDVAPMVPEEIPAQTRAAPPTEDAGKRPPLKRSRIRAAKKTQLEEWSKAYGLSTKGNREALRNRLLTYMDEQHMADQEEVTIVEASIPSEAPVDVPPSQAPTDETAQEPETYPPPEPEPALPETAEPPEPISTREETILPSRTIEPEPEEIEAEPAPPLAETPEPELERVAREPSLPPAEPQQPSPSPEKGLDRIPEAVLPTWPPPVRVIEASAQPEPAAMGEPTPATTRTASTTPSMPPAPQTTATVQSMPTSPQATAMVQPMPTAPRVAPIAKPAEPTVARVEVAKALACPNCGRELTFISRYDRLYCFSCGRYAPKGYGRDRLAVEVAKPVSAAPAAVAAPTVVVAKPVEAPKAVEARPENVCPTCGRTMRYVKEYQRWWCEAERKYAPRRVRNPCPTCSRELSYVRTYDRWYCSYEKKYAPKSYQAAVPPTASAPTAVAELATPSVTQVRPAPAAAAAATVQAATTAVRAAHTHRAPLAGIALAATGFSLLIVWFLFLPVLGPLNAFGVLPTVTAISLLPIMSIVGLVGLVLGMAGVIAGLMFVRAR
jgi:ribosomal protein S27AE